MCGIIPKRRAKYARISPKQSRTPEQIERKQSAAEDPRGLYHAGTMPTESARNDRDKPEQFVTVSPCRIFRGSPVGGVDSRFTVPLFVMPEKRFLRLSAIFSAELRQITVMRNY